MINIRIVALTAFAALTLAAAFWFSSPTPAADTKRITFDHLTTGFPLTGAHSRATCDSCHIGGMFRGTPRNCESCHIQGNRMGGQSKPANHIPTNLACDQCHRSTVSWAVVRFDHTTIAPGTCVQCHNGRLADGKPSNHMPTAMSCDNCHRTTAWVPSSFNHTSVTPGSCLSCHNGSQATGKPSSHIPTTLSCDACHTTRTFATSTFKHTVAQGVLSGQCITCHSGAYRSQGAAGKPGDHPITNESCDQCHSTRTWDR